MPPPPAARHPLRATTTTTRPVGPPDGHAQAPGPGKAQVQLATAAGVETLSAATGVVEREVEEGTIVVGRATARRGRGSGSTREVSVRTKTAGREGGDTAPNEAVEVVGTRGRKRKVVAYTEPEEEDIDIAEDAEEEEEVQEGTLKRARTRATKGKSVGTSGGGGAKRGRPRKVVSQSRTGTRSAYFASAGAAEGGGGATAITATTNAATVATDTGDAGPSTSSSTTTTSSSSTTTASTTTTSVDPAPTTTTTTTTTVQANTGKKLQRKQLGNSGGEVSLALHAGIGIARIQSLAAGEGSSSGGPGTSTDRAVKAEEGEEEEEEGEEGDTITVGKASQRISRGRVRVQRVIKKEEREEEESGIEAGEAVAEEEEQQEDLEEVEEEEAESESDTKKRKRPQKQKGKGKAKGEQKKPSTEKGKGKRKATSKEEQDEAEEAEGGSSSEGGRKPKLKKQRAPRKSKEEREEEKRMAAIPLAARNTEIKWLVGAHVSAAKGVQNAVTNSNHIGGNAFALFLKSQRKWTSPPLKKEDITAFKKFCEEQGYDPKRHILPHGNYLINLAQMDEEKHKQAYDCFLDDLKRCELLGIGLYNFHPGSCLTNPRPASILRLAQSLNAAHKATHTVKTVLENMAGHGTHLGSTLEDLRDIIQHVENKSRVGVCIDTCHAFAAGYDLRTRATFDKFWDDFDRIVGREYLVALHLNDSKAPLGARRDLHESIGAGWLGLESFRLLMNRKELHGIPMVLETPILDPAEWAREIKLLEGLVGLDGTEESFLESVRVLQERGRKERERVGDVVRRREEKEEKKKASGAKREARRKVKEEEEEEEGGEVEGKKKKRAPRKKAVAGGKKKKKVVETEDEDDDEEEEEENGADGSGESSVDESAAESEDEEDGGHKCNHG